MNAVLFDYGAGNLHSLVRAFAEVGVALRTEPDIMRCLDQDLLVLPGVGAFGLAAERIAPGRIALREALAAGLPCLGICLGMQLLFESSEEGAGAGAGLGLMRGRVRRLQGRRVPHMGWTRVSTLEAPMYFAHSYACIPDEPEIIEALATHEAQDVAAIVRQGRTVGVQFHPEKSSKAGIALLGVLVASVQK